MKALIISDEENFSLCMDNFFNANNVNTIIYKWLLKALDNIEEIHPDIIVLSAAEYPRHWKTLVQFVKSGIGGDDVSIFLYEPSELSEDDEEKIKLLGINGVFKTLEPEQIAVISSAFDSVENAKKEKVHDGIIALNPFTNAFITGSVTCTPEKQLCLEADFIEQVEFIKEGAVIPKITLLFADECKTVCAKVQSIESNKIYLGDYE